LHVILGDEAVLVPEARFYQRLLAMDDHEARAVADSFLLENPLAQLYDAVIIPALTLAEQDRHKGALDQAREEFLFLSVKEMLVEFSELAVKSDAGERAVTLPGRVFCIPANDEADEITAAMLAQVLEQAGYVAISFSLDPALQEAVALMEPAENDTFCISALPPFAFARARALSRQLQSRFPRTKMMIGLWGFAGDTESALQRFQPSHPDKLATSLADAVTFIAGPDAAVVDLETAELTTTPR